MSCKNCEPETEPEISGSDSGSKLLKKCKSTLTCIGNYGVKISICLIFI